MTLAEIMREAIKHPLLKDILATPAAEISTGEGRTTFVRNTNHLLWSDEGLLVGKTGFTREARHCFAAAGERGPGRSLLRFLVHQAGVCCGRRPKN